MTFFGSSAYFAVEACFFSGIETCLPDMSKEVAMLP